MNGFKRLAIGALVLSACGPARAIPTVIDGNNAASNGFFLVTTDNTGTPAATGGSASFVTGPSTPPLGIGSVNFQTAPNNGDQSAQLRSTNFTGTALSAITALQYSTYATSFNGAQLPYLTLYLDNTGAKGGGTDRLFFEPTYSPGEGTVQTGAWQSWNVLTGNVYADSIAAPGESYANYLSDNPGAVIAVDPSNPSLGGIRFASGFASTTDNFNTNVDDFVFNSSTFDFEPSAPEMDPSTSTLPFVIALGGLCLVSDRRRKRG